MLKIKFAIILMLISFVLHAQNNAGLTPVMKNGKYGFMNARGDTVIGLIYDNAENFSDGRALVTKKSPGGYNHYYYLDVTGKIIVNCDSLKSVLMISGKDTTFDYWLVLEANSFRYGIALLSCSGKQMPDNCHHYKYIKKNGRPIQSYEFSFAVNFENGYGRGFQNGQYYQIDTLGEMTPFNVDACDCFDGFIPFYFNNIMSNQALQFPEFDRGKSDLNSYVAANQFFCEKNTGIHLTLWLKIDRFGHVTDWSLMDIFNHKYSKKHYLSPEIEQFVKKMPPFKPASIRGVPFCSRISIEMNISENALSARFR